MTRTELLNRIQTLMQYHFTYEELIILCYDAADFLAVYQALPQSVSTKKELGQRLLAHADDQWLLPELLTALEKEVASRPPAETPTPPRPQPTSQPPATGKDVDIGNVGGDNYGNLNFGDITIG